MTIKEAAKWAQARYATVYNLQTWGHEYNPGQQTKSFCDEHFRLGNLPDQRGKIPILFDRRNGEREGKLLARFQSKLPIILYNLSGYSSPFPHGDLVRQELSRYAGVATLIDTHTIKADCIVDLLALYSIAAVLITIDTATLHLASASRVPYIALTVDDKKPWHTSPPLGNCRLNIPYARTAAMLPQFRQLMDSLVEVPAQPVAPALFRGRIIHATDSYWLIESRCQNAVASWALHYKLGSIHCAHTPSLGLFKRDSRDVGSKRKLTFLKDILQHALQFSTADDVILWTNSDAIMAPNFVQLLKGRLTKAPIITSRRVDNATGKPHPGRDAAAFSVEWLKAHWDEIPDLLCGCAEVDVWMALAAREQVGLVTETASRLFIDVDPVDMPAGSLRHLDHGVSPWDNPQTRYSEPANVYNVGLLRAWCRTHQPKVQFNKSGFVVWTI